MRKSFTLLSCLLLFGSVLFGQQLEALSGVQLSRPESGVSRHSNAMLSNRITAAACGPDTVGYALGKGTGLTALTVNNATSASALGQYYDCPQPITLSGARFYAWKTNTTGGISINVTLQVFNAGLDSLPTGAALATRTVAVDTNFYGGNLGSLQKVGMFTAPIVVTGPYIVVVTNNSPNSIALVCNDYAANDGAGEWLSDIQIGANWLRSYNVNVAGAPFDADVIVEPVVSYTLAANFTVNPSCIVSAGTATFTNTSSPVFKNRMYSLAEFLGIGGAGVTWDFGDGSPAVTQTTNYDTTHTYAAAGSYTVSLKDTLFGWTMTCAADTAITLGAAPSAAFNSSANNFVVAFSDQSTGGPASWFWDFGDGNTSTQQNPSHTYAAGGTYTVCLTTTSPCGSDSSCQTVNVSCPVPNTAFSSNANNLAVAFTDQSTGSGINVWMWTFGDGNTSLSQNPSNTYATPGTYTVCLITTNACGTDSSCQTVTVTCPTTTSGFTASSNLLVASFTDQTTGAPSTWAWDFGDGGTSTLASPTHTYAAAGTYTVCLITSNSCGADTICQPITVVAVGITETLAQQVVLYPNPANGMAHFKIDLSTAQAMTVEVMDLRGAKLAELDLGTVHTGTYDLPLANFANGSYWLRFSTATGSVVKQLNVLK